MKVETEFKDYKDIGGILNSIQEALTKFGITMKQDPETVDTDGYSFILSDEPIIVKQSIPNGTKVIFDNQGITYKEFFDMEDCPIQKKEYKKLDGKKCTIVNLETFSKLGEKDFEYYNIKFKNGLELIGVSGYNLRFIN